MFQNAHLLRLLSVVVTLLLLALLAYHGARFFWQAITDTPTVSVPTVTMKEHTETPWLSSLRLHVPKAEPKAVALVPAQKKPIIKPSDDVQNWRLKGVYAEDGDSIAIIQTTEGSRIVEVGDIVAGSYIVTNITPTQAVVSGEVGKLTLNLVVRQIDALTENTSPVTAKPEQNKQQNTFKTNDWQKYLRIKPLLENGQAAFKVTATNTDGQTLLSSVGLQSGDVILSIDGQTPSPQTWGILAVKLRQSQKIRAKINRNGTIQTITIQQ